MVVCRPARSATRGSRPPRAARRESRTPAGYHVACPRSRPEARRYQAPALWLVIEREPCLRAARPASLETGSGTRRRRSSAHFAEHFSGHGAMPGSRAGFPEAADAATRGNHEQRTAVADVPNGNCPFRARPAAHEVPAPERGPPRSATMSASPRLPDGELAAAISTTVVKALARTTGRGPTKAKT